MKPTQQEIIEQLGVAFDRAVEICGREFVAKSLMERFGSGGGEPVAWEMFNPTTGHAIVDYSRQTYVGHLKQEDGYEARPLFAGPPSAEREELLEALKNLESVFTEGAAASRDWRNRARLALIASRAAIAKATGQ